jgi:hypothetical protein
VQPLENVHVIVGDTLAGASPPDPYYHPKSLQGIERQPRLIEDRRTVPDTEKVLLEVDLGISLFL